MGTIYQSGGNSLYDSNGQTFYANGPNAGSIYNAPSSTAAPAPSMAPSAPSPAPTTTSQPAPMLPGLGGSGYTNPNPVNFGAIAPAQQNLSQYLQSNGANPTQASQLAGAATTPTDSTYAKASGYTGPSIVDFLNTAGQPSSYADRSALAAKYGIQNYTGTADQNTQLLHILQGHNASVSPTGVPSNTGQVLGASTGPSSGSPLDLSKLGTGGLDLSKILGASAANGSGVPSDIAGLLSLYGAQTEAGNRNQSYEQDLISAMHSMGGEAGDLSSAENAPGGYNENIKHVQDLSLQAAKLKGSLDSFDAESQQGIANISGQAIPMGLIQGQQAAYQKQRDLTRLSMAAELSSTTSLIAAYQGNADTALKLAQQSVDMKYAPVQNEIDTLKQQISFAQNDMSREDTANTRIISALLDWKTQQLSDQKTTATKLQTLGVQAASGGAPLSLVQSAIASGDPVQASSILSSYLKGPTESVTSTAGGGTSGGATSTSVPKTGVIQSGTIVATQGDIDTGAQALKASASQGAEADGKYADPNLYLRMYEHWINSGGKQADFFKYYPYSTYINPANTWLSQSLSDFNGSGSGGGGGGAQTP